MIQTYIAQTINCNNSLIYILSSSLEYLYFSEEFQQNHTIILEFPLQVRAHISRSARCIMQRNGQLLLISYAVRAADISHIICICRDNRIVKHTQIFREFVDKSTSSRYRYTRSQSSRHIRDYSRPILTAYVGPRAVHRDRRCSLRGRCSSSCGRAS
jgi:hypothetical protein